MTWVTWVAVGATAWMVAVLVIIAWFHSGTR